MVRSVSQDRQGHSRDHVEEDTEQNVRTRQSTRRRGRWMHHQTPQRSTTQHSKSVRSATDATLPGDLEPTGGSRQDTHGTPVLITIRRPWLNFTSTRTRHKSQTQAVSKGGDQTAWWRSKSTDHPHMVAEHPHMVAEHPYMEAHPQHDSIKR